MNMKAIYLINKQLTKLKLLLLSVLCLSFLVINCELLKEDPPPDDTSCGYAYLRIKNGTDTENIKVFVEGAVYSGCDRVTPGNYCERKVVSGVSIEWSAEGLTTKKKWSGTKYLIDCETQTLNLVY